MRQSPNLLTIIFRMCLQQQPFPKPALGIAWKEVPFVRVHWAWLSFQAALAAGSGILLFATIIQSEILRVVAWKSSSLAALYGLVGDDDLYCAWENGSAKYHG